MGRRQGKKQQSLRKNAGTDSDGGFFRLRVWQAAIISTPSMSQIPNDLKFATSHEWVRIEGDVAVVGVSDHAQEEMTDVVFVELPEVGRTVAAGEAVAVVECVKAASDIYSPVSGEIVDANGALEGDPSLINSEPYAGGWIYKIKLSDPSEADAMMDASAYAGHIGQ